MDSKKRPSVPQRKQILAGGAFGVVKREPEPDAAEVDASRVPSARRLLLLHGNCCCLIRCCLIRSDATSRVCLCVCA